jgi:hypothetical protein
MTNDYFTEALEEITPATDSILARVLRGEKVFATTEAYRDVHAFDNDFDAKHSDKATGHDAFGYFG